MLVQSSRNKLASNTYLHTQQLRRTSDSGVLCKLGDICRADTMNYDEASAEGGKRLAQGWLILIPLLVATCLVFGVPSAIAQVVATVGVPATAQWVNTGIDVTTSEFIDVTASGTWTDGDTTSGPDGAANLWPDNFLNLLELGVCNTCATQSTPGWGALIGYIGSSPPAPGSYTSRSVLPEAVKIFYIGSHLKKPAPLSGRLWLNKNADAYSGYTVDNIGAITATVTVSAAQHLPLPPAPGWYNNSGASGGNAVIYVDSELTIAWGSSYIYQHPGTPDLYWYAEVIYLNKGVQSSPISCSGRTDPSLAKELIRGTEGLGPNAAGYVAADATFCSQNPDFSGSIEPGATHFEWAIFHNVPPGGEVALQWAPYSSSSWLDPWSSAFPPDAPTPSVCPPELVTLGTCAEKHSEAVSSFFVCLGGANCNGQPVPTQPSNSLPAPPQFLTSPLSIECIDSIRADLATLLWLVSWVQPAAIPAAMLLSLPDVIDNTLTLNTNLKKLDQISPQLQQTTGWTDPRWWSTLIQAALQVKGEELTLQSCRDLVAELNSSGSESGGGAG